MLGEFEEDLKGFDVTKPFVLHKKSVRFPFIAKSPQPTMNRLMEFKNNIPTTKDFHLLDFGSFKAKTLSQTQETQANNFYLSYLEYFVGLLLKFNAVNGISGFQIEENEKKKYDMLGKRIVCLVKELLDKNVSAEYK
jgi:hypothetical protein